MLTEEIFTKNPEEGFIMYKVTKGLFPVSAHRGEVRFTKGKVTWKVYMTPVFGLGWAVSPITRFSIRRMLATLKTRLEASPAS